MDGRRERGVGLEAPPVHVEQIRAAAALEFEIKVMHAGSAAHAARGGDPRLRVAGRGNKAGAGHGAGQGVEPQFDAATGRGAGHARQKITRASSKIHAPDADPFSVGDGGHIQSAFVANFGFDAALLGDGLGLDARVGIQVLQLWQTVSGGDDLLN